MTDKAPDTGAMRMAFWTWMAIIAIGLAVMIVLPLMGR
jgi:predicted nucleic acid-binding Zn ribbon protein